MRGARFLTFFSCVATIFAAPIPVRAARPGAHRQSSIPFIYEDARIYVPVRIEGGEPRWFVLDTGATGTIIDSAVARAAHLTTCGSESVYGAGNGASQQTWTRTVRLKVGGVPLRLTQPAVLDLAHLLGPTSGRAPAGIIGSQFFEEHFVAIDFEARRITVYPPAADRRALYSFAAPLTFADSTPLTHVELTLPEGRTVSANALVDLGAKSTFLIPEPFIDRDKLRTSLPKAVVTGFGAGVGETLSTPSLAQAGSAFQGRLGPRSTGPSSGFRLGEACARRGTRACSAPNSYRGSEWASITATGAFSSRGAVQHPCNSIAAGSSLSLLDSHFVS